MTGRPLAVTERQARTLLRAANKERGQVELVIDGAVVRLIPEVLAKKPEDDAEPVDAKPKGYL